MFASEPVSRPVEADDTMPLPEERLAEVRAEEAGATGDE
jgi:hypothetical protein